MPSMEQAVRQIIIEWSALGFCRFAAEPEQWVFFAKSCLALTSDGDRLIRWWNGYKDYVDWAGRYKPEMPHFMQYCRRQKSTEREAEQPPVPEQHQMDPVKGLSATEFNRRMGEIQARRDAEKETKDD